MIKTLRITSIIAAILAGIFFVLPVVFGVRSDEQVEQLLNSPDVIEKFSKAKTDTARGEGQSSPLVKQAQAFALYLNPPQPKIGSDGKSTRVGPRGPVEAKFTVIGTSFCPARPELSLAFINEPGKGLRLVRQSSQIGHLVIEQIKDGLVVVRDGQRTFELAPEKISDLGETSTSPVESLNRDGKSTLIRGSSTDPRQRTRFRPASPTVRKTSAGIVKVKGAKPGEPQLSEEQSAALERLVDRLKNMQKNMKSESIDESEEYIEKIITDFQAGRISEEEAEKLVNLGEELEEEVEPED